MEGLQPIAKKRDLHFLDVVSLDSFFHNRGGRFNPLDDSQVDYVLTVTKVDFQYYGPSNKPTVSKLIYDTGDCSVAYPVKSKRHSRAIAALFLNQYVRGIDQYLAIRSACSLANSYGMELVKESQNDVGRV